MDKLKIEYLPVEALTPYKTNARKHESEDVQYIKNSIQEFGMKDPIGIWGKDNIIVEGHGRLMAVKELGIKEVPCIRLDDLTDEQRKAYALAHNRTAEMSEWDSELLDFELDNIFDINMENFGFELADDEPEEITEDEAPEVNEEAEPIANKGEIWQLGRHRLMCGDSTDRECIEALMNGNEAHMVFTDPPYGIDVVSDNGKVGADFGIAKKGNYSKVIADDTTETAMNAYEILKEYSKKLILWGGNYFTDFLPFSDGWIIWDKRCDSGIKNTFADGEMAWCSFHTPVRIYHQLWNGMIREGEHEKRVHPTQKPIKMLSEILNDFSKEDENILDVFGGSGSTLIACEQTNRNCYMMELDPKYVDVIIKRWEDFTGEKAVLING